MKASSITADLAANPNAHIISFFDQ